MGVDVGMELLPPASPPPSSAVPLPEAGRIWEAALELVGVPFRLHGRDPGLGLDCVGVARVAVGARVEVPERYGFRGGSAKSWSAAIDACGMVRRGDTGGVGDVVLIDCGRGQFHVAVAGPASAVHAHRGLGRVVETPGLPAGAVVGRWRLAEREE